MPGEIGIRHQRADPQTSAGGLLDLRKRQSRDVDQSGRTFDILFHEVEQVGAACYEFRRGIGRDLPHGIGDIVGPRVLEVDHEAPITCWMAATMLG